MPICTKCGAAVAESAKFCTVCGTSVQNAPQPQVSPPAQNVTSAPQPVQAPPPVYTQPVQSTAPTGIMPGELPPPKGSKYAPISTWGYIGWIVLMCLPFVGWIITVILAVIDGPINRRNLARAFLVFLIAGFIFAVIAGIVAAVVWFSVSSQATNQFTSNWPY